MTGPRIIGLTGSIGMGKSTVAAMFADAGVPVFDADAEVRALQGPGGVLVPAIEAAFPGSTDDGGVRRDALGKQVFADPDRLAVLEGIVHPAIAAARKDFMERHADAPMVIFDIPLLFERGGDSGVDAVIVVSAPEAVQRARVLARDGMTALKLDHILGLQTPDAQKRARADHIIDTGVPIAETRAAVRNLIAELYATCQLARRGE